VHVLTPFVERLATEEEKKRGIISPEVLNRSTAELQQRYRQERRQAAGSIGQQRHRASVKVGSAATL